MYHDLKTDMARLGPGGIYFVSREYFRPHSFSEIADIIRGWFRRCGGSARPPADG
jgi:hypothetical protein